MIGDLVMACFHARTAAHVLHLRTRSYAEHKALNEFYDAVVDIADGLAEAYQGGYGLIPSFPAKYTAYTDARALLADLRECVDECSTCWKPEDTHLTALADELRALIASTQYKLKFLK